MRELVNLVVDLDEGLATLPAAPPAGTEIAAPVAAADDRTLAWIDETFGGSWSSEAYAGANIVARRNGAPVGFAAFDPKGLRFAWLRGLAREPGVGIFGPFGVAAAERKTGLGPLLLARALAALRERGYARALIPAVGGERLIRYYAQSVGARVAERFEAAILVAKRPRTLLMASGNGSNVGALLGAVRDGRLPLDVRALVSNDPHAYAIERARAAGVPVVVLPWTRRAQSRSHYDAQLLEAVRREEPELVLLLGWMHLLDAPFVRAFPEMLNLHPAFLPLDPQRDDVGMPDGSFMAAYRGPRAVRDALAAGSRWIGATVHRVTPATDRGPVFIRRPMPVAAGEDEASVMARLHPIEHALVLSAVTRWLYESIPLSS